jgi:RHS repeat-associated protein
VESSRRISPEISGYTYNDAGEETAITGYNEPASTGFAYNNLKQLEGLTPPEKAEEKLKYLGSGQSTLVGLGTTTLQNSALGITKQTIEGNASYYARTPGGTLVDERLPGGTTYNPIYDAQGDIIGLLNSSGELVQTIQHGPYGQNANTTGMTYSATADPFMFQGGYHTLGGDAGTGNVPNGLYHFGERYYNPTTGRWTQPDPLSRSTPEYVFADDTPINDDDPTGSRALGKLENGFCANLGALPRSWWKVKENRETARNCQQEEIELGERERWRPFLEGAENGLLK